ncbi:MAG: non-heme iron oxygenase ferredoxin subunit [Magnetococcales bacterium]|nr:non-heme iron oxygenase ferredoxin subunit [Magnetococcales bacterium]
MQTSKEWLDVARVEDFPPGSMRSVTMDGRDVVVFHVDGSFHALLDCCTHDGGDLSSGTLAGAEIICPRHEARFDVRTGMVRAPPAYEDVPVVEVRVCHDRVQLKR